MNGLQKAAGFASIIQAVGYVAILLFVLVLLPNIGIHPGDLNSSEKVLSAVTSPFLNEYYPLFLVFGLTIIVTLGVYDRLQGNPPVLMQVALAAALAASVFWISYAMFGSAMVSILRSLNAQNPSLSQGAFVSATIVINGLLYSAPFAGSFSIVLWGWAGVQTRKLPIVLSYLVILTGIYRLTAFFAPSLLASPLNLIHPVLSIIWGVWLGVVLLQEK